MPGTTLGVGYKIMDKKKKNYEQTKVFAFTSLLQTKTDKEQIQTTISGSDNDEGKNPEQTE